jgi:hypothetical protein
MHPWRPWIVLATLAAFAGQAAVVYKWTDSSGVVHYSDQPVPGAEKIYTASSTANGGGNSANAGNAPASGAAPPASNRTAPGLNFNQFSITSPAPDQTFFGDDVVSVHLALDPILGPDQSITWHLNGKQLDDQGPAATQLTIQHLVRGTYILAATITDQKTGESQTSDSVTFFVHQPSEFAPLHQRP